MRSRLDYRGVPSVHVEDPEPRGELRHHLDAMVLGHLARLRSRRALERDAIYRAVRPEIERVLAGFDWNLEVATDRRPRQEGRVRAVAWNVERGKRFEPLIGLLREHPELAGTDLLLLTELDIGMGRSDNRHVPRELATTLGMDWVFANFHLVLAPGDEGEQGHDMPNEQGLHGAALLSRFPIRRFAAVSVPEFRDKFRVLEKRLGSKRALLAEVEFPDGPVTVVVVHLDPFSSPRHRARQMRRVMRAVEEFGGERVLLGGDFNSNTWDLGNPVRLFAGVAHKLVRYGVAGSLPHYMHPGRKFERKTFEALRRAGLNFDAFTDAGRGSIYYDLSDPELVDKSLGFLPGPALRWLERQLEPWGRVLPLRVDWFAGRGLRPLRAETVDRPQFDGLRVSDHNPLVVDLELGQDADARPMLDLQPPRETRGEAAE